MNLRERKKLAAWRAIRAAALQLFEEQGYAATTIEQIATVANVSRATFFNYFAGKEAVLFDPDPGERDDLPPQPRCQVPALRLGSRKRWTPGLRVVAMRVNFGLLHQARRG